MQSSEPTETEREREREIEFVLSSHLDNEEEEFLIIKDHVTRLIYKLAKNRKLVKSLAIPFTSD